MPREFGSVRYSLCSWIFSPSYSGECKHNTIHSNTQRTILMTFMQETVLITIGALECQCDCTQAHTNALSQTFTIARTRKRTYTQTHVHTNALTHKRTNTQTHVHTNARTRKRTYTQTHVHAIARTHKRTYTQTRLNERKFALAFAAWAVFVFECVQTLHVRSKTFKTYYIRIYINLHQLLQCIITNLHLKPHYNL